MSDYDNVDNTYDRDVYGYDEPMVGPLDAPEKPTGLHPVNIAHLVMGVALEYGKLGRLTLESDFERFHDLVRSPR